jgi:acyl-CoA synthetase (AMP-forming)/AMP-acid ligase II
VTAERVVDFCTAHLAAFKVPRYVEYHDDFPRTSSGKIAKQQLVEPRATLVDTRPGRS